MHLSIFSFKRLTYSYALLLLLIGVSVFLFTLEVVTSIGLIQVSKIAKRMHQDYVKALSLRPTTQNGHQTILIIGNSLLLLGVDRNKLTKELLPEYSLALWPIENTTYLDWYFGLRRIFAEGSRPSVVVLCLNIRQLTSNSLNGESFAHHMMRLNDIVLVKRSASLDMTTTSNYFFANLSNWLGNKWGIRNWILETWLPNASLLAAALGSRATSTSEWKQGEYIELSLRRLRELRDLCEAYGSRFLFLIPPQSSKDDLVESIRVLNNDQSGISILIPYLPGEMEGIYFTDGFHLNSIGASLFTDRLLQLIRSNMASNFDR